MDAASIPGRGLGRFLCRGSFGGGKVAENELGRLVRLPVAQYFCDIAYAHIDFAVGVVGQVEVYHPLVKTELSAVRGDFQHIVNIRLHTSGVYLGGALR